MFSAAMTVTPFPCVAYAVGARANHAGQPPNVSLLWRICECSQVFLQGKSASPGGDGAPCYLMPLCMKLLMN